MDDYSQPNEMKFKQQIWRRISDKLSMRLPFSRLSTEQAESHHSLSCYRGVFWVEEPITSNCLTAAWAPTGLLPYWCLFGGLPGLTGHWRSRNHSARLFLNDTLQPLKYGFSTTATCYGWRMELQAVENTCPINKHINNANAATVVALGCCIRSQHPGIELLDHSQL